MDDQKLSTSTKQGAQTRKEIEDWFFTSFMGKALVGAEQLQETVGEMASGSTTRPNYPKKIIETLAWRPTAEDYK